MLTLRRAGVSDARVLAAFDFCDRAGFVDPGFAELAQEDVAIPLPCGQTSLRPTALALMLDALSIEQDSALLLIGAGSGYSAAIAARVARQVTALERYRTLSKLASENLARDGMANAHVLQTDGLAPIGDGSSFDRILLTGSVAVQLHPWLERLTPGGVLVAPVRDEAGQCMAQRWRAGSGTPDLLFALEVDPLEGGLPQLL